MFTRRITLCRLFGIAIHIDMSWLLIAGFVTWSFSVNYFPEEVRNQPFIVYLLMGLGVAAGLLFSIVFHEMSHCLVAQKQGISIQGITLFLFGGVAEMESEPPSPKAEFLMTIAGPLASLFLAGVIWGICQWLQVLEWGQALYAVLAYVMFLNLGLAIFNMIPAFPLDGGRILRSVLWHFKGSLRWATGICANLGSAFGIIMIVGGVLLVFNQHWGGIWTVFIGFFIRYAARMSYQQMLVRRGLEGEQVRRFMRENPVTVSASVGLRDFVENYVYRHHYKMFPVMENGTLQGCVTTTMLKAVPMEEWGNKKVSDILQPCSDENTIAPDADAMRALTKMNQNQVSRLMVVERGSLRGILSLKDLLDFLSLKIDLED